MGENWIDFADAQVFAPGSKERESIVAVKGRDDLADICGQVTDQIRQAYLFGSRELGPDKQIPEGLKLRAIAIALWRFVSESVPKNEAIQTKQRESAFREACEYLDKIAQGEMGKVTDPSVACRPKRFGHHQEEGI